MPGAVVWEWWAGLDEEFLTLGPFTKKADAINDGVADFDGDPFWVMQATRRPFKLDANRLLLDQYYEQDELFDYEHSEPGRTGTKAEQDDADKALQDALNEWVATYGDTFTAPTLFERVGERVLIKPTNVPPDAQ